MSFFKKKNKDQKVSTLSEDEIQKKLYGEFYSHADRVAGSSERMNFKGTATLATTSRETSKASLDLFSSQRDFLVDPQMDSAERKEIDSATKQVPFHGVEKKESALPAKTFASESYPRLQSNRYEGKAAETDFFSQLKKFVAEGVRFLTTCFAPQNIAARRILYWGAAVGVVFLLFGGVNKLNTNREIAMKSKYKIGEAKPVSSTEALVASAPLPVTTTSEVPAVESSRPVVITPVPVKPKALAVVSSAVREERTTNSLPYVIQVVTYPSQRDAEQIVNALKREQLKAFIKENKRPSGRVFYVVYLGGFRTEAEAQAQLLKFRAKEVARPFPDAFVRANS